MTLQDKYDYIFEDARAEGLEAGRAEGRAESFAQELVAHVESLIAKLDMSTEDACTALGHSYEEYSSAKATIEKL